LLEVAPITEDVSIETRARVLNQKGFALSRSGNFVRAKEALEVAKRLGTAAGSRALLAEIEINRATLFFYLSKYDEVEAVSTQSSRYATTPSSFTLDLSRCIKPGAS
jgi:hypothetical protein